jgi:hypothetical protein
MQINKLSLRNVVVIAICLAGVTKVVAQGNEQFPSPQNFQMIPKYIELGDWGYCNGSVQGPSHCTHFMWTEPNISETEAQLVGYKLYNYPTLEELVEIPFDEGIVIDHPISSGLYVSR